MEDPRALFRRAEATRREADIDSRELGVRELRLHLAALKRQEAMARHLRYDGSLSVADCVSLALMERRQIRTIVSFDRDFDQVRGLRRVH